MSRPCAGGRRSDKGFTLVEVLIVVVILGILASAVVARFGGARTATAENALRDNLRWMRNAVLLYEAQHGEFPTEADFEAQMTGYTDVNGVVGAARDDTYQFGAYLLSLPGLPVGGQQGQTGVTGPAYADGFGWQYDETTGTLRANTEDSEVDEAGQPYNTY